MRIQMLFSCRQPQLHSPFLIPVRTRACLDRFPHLEMTPGSRIAMPTFPTNPCSLRMLPLGQPSQRGPTTVWELHLPGATNHTASVEHSRRSLLSRNRQVRNRSLLQYHKLCLRSMMVGTTPVCHANLAGLIATEWTSRGMSLTFPHLKADVSAIHMTTTIAILGHLRGSCPGRKPES